TIALNNHTEQIKNDLGNQFSELHILKEELNAQFLQIKSEVDTIHATTNDFAKNTQGQMVASLQQTQTQTTESVQQCTSTILEDLQKVKDSQKHLVDTIRILDENIQAVKTSQEKFNKKASAGWVFFALCFPLIAAIVYLANVRQNPQRAKMLGLGIFISLLLTLCVVIAGVVLLLLNQYNILTLPWIPILPGHKI
ncbi:MAG: hypothetical protein FWD76_06335, partial [Firmicutes bacterium]|nr:hypothetical protein [Bacillota bacterium]